MQLQRRIDELRDPHIEPYAVSYDTPEKHCRFVDEFGISHHLLSTADSATINQFVILKTLVEPDHPIRTSSGRSFHGIPVPGIYIVDTDGIVREEYFNRSYTTRNSTGMVLNSALGAVLRPEAASEQSWQSERIGFRAFLSDPTLRLEYAITLYVRFELADGTEADSKGISWVEPGENVTIRSHGGGGFGPPEDRPAEILASDLLDGYITDRAVEEDYGR